MKRRSFLESIGVGTMGAVMGRAMIGKQLEASFFENGGACDNIIIGTGYGGAVAAERLGEKGCEVLMLELGMDWEQYKVDNPDFKFSKMTSPEKESTWMNTSTQAPIGLGNTNSFEEFTGVLAMEQYDNVKVYMGRGIGGGSLANGGMTVTPRADYFTKIFADAGVAIPTAEFTDTYFPKAYTQLGGAEVPADVYASEWYQFSRVGVAEGVAAGFTEKTVPNIYDFDYMRGEINGTITEGSATNIEVIYGNNYGKKDLTKTYIKRALATGNVTIMPQHRVNYIIDNNDGTYDLNVSLIDTKAQEVANKTFKAGRLFMGAGSLGTTKLLLKSKQKGTMPKVDTSKVGRYWGNNGNTMCSRLSYLPALTQDTDRGSNQSTMPVRGLDNWEDANHSFFAEIAPMPTLGTFTGMYLVVSQLSDEPTKRYGAITYDAASDEIDIHWGRENNLHMKANAAYFLEKMNGVTADGVYVNNSVLFPAEEGRTGGIDERVCYHPLGGVVLGRATDMYGRLNNHRNLYIMDGSLIPGSLGVNPYLTITAMAERNIETIIVEDCNDCNERTLPVEFKEFKVETAGNNAVLTWSTLSEINNKQFNIERSLDGTHFETIDSVQGNGNSTTENTYSHTDYGVGNENNIVYYRLEQVDFDGTSTLSKTELVSFSGNIETVIFPNLVSTGEQVNVKAKNIKNITVYDILGKKVISQSYSGQQLVKLSTNALTTGTYFVTVNFKKTMKLVVR